MEALPGYVSTVFILTAFTAVGFLLQAVRTAGLEKFPSKLLLFILPLWIIFQSITAIAGSYLDTSHFPPRLMLIGILPALCSIGFYLLFFKRSFIDRLPLNLLTLLHIVRIPVELVLYWLFLGGLVPRVMTFSGWNFDIVSGGLAIIAYLVAFRSGRTSKPILLVFNAIGLIFLANIVVLAVLSLPSPVQQFGFDQPNIAVLYFPYSLLPTLVVPVVLFSHVASISKLLSKESAN